MMKTTLKLRRIGVFLSLMLLCSCAATHPRLPGEVTINKEAGRGGLLIVTVRMENGRKLPCILDTGSTGNLLDVSLEPMLGKARGRITMNSWGRKVESRLYAAPKLYLGGVQLMTGTNIWVMDFSRLASRSGPRPLGLLGFDCLRHYCVQLDFEAEKARFLDPGHLEVEKLGKAFPITVSGEGGRPYIYCPNLAGVPSTNVLTDPNFLERRENMPGTYALIDSGFTADGRVGRGAIKGHDFGRVRLPECVWEGGTYTNIVVGVEEQANLLGLRFLARHLVTLDFPSNTMYLKQTRIGPLQ